MEMQGTQKDLSILIGLTPRRIRELRQTEGMFIPDNKTKKYNLPACVKEFIQYRIQSESPSGNADYEKERAEHEKAKKEITQLKLRKLRKELHEAADVELIVGDMLTCFRSKLLSMPPKLAPQLIGLTDSNEILNIIKLDVSEALQELSDYSADDYDEDVGEDETEDEEIDI